MMRESKRCDLSLVIACYNEEPLLNDSVEQVIDVLDHTGLTYELLFVDDFSQDDTRTLIDGLVIKYADRALRKLFHNSNMGRGRTVSDGFRMARGDVIGYLDIDLEVHARYAPEFVRVIKHGADLAIARRVYKVRPSVLHRAILSKGYAWLVRRLLHIDIRDTEAGFKFFKRASLLSVLDKVEDPGWFWDTEIVARFLMSGYSVVEIPCVFEKRYDKKSTVKVARDSIEYFRRLWRFRRMIQPPPKSG